MMSVTPMYNVFDKDPYSELRQITRKQIVDILNIYEEAVVFAITQNDSMDIRSGKEPIKRDKYKEFATRIHKLIEKQWNFYYSYDQVVDGGTDYNKDNLPKTFDDNVDTFLGLKMRLSNLIEKMMVRIMIDRDFFKKSFDLNDKDYNEYLKPNNTRKFGLANNDGSYVYYLLNTIEKKQESTMPQKAGNGKKAKEKIHLKENGRKYVVHVNEKKQKFIKQRGQNVLLSSIRGKYNYVN